MSDEIEIKIMWYVDSDPQLKSPRQVSITEQLSDGFSHCSEDLMWYRSDSLFDTEKDAINAVRKLRIAEIKRLEVEVNALDARYDAIEDAEMKAGGE